MSDILEQLYRFNRPKASFHFQQ